MDFTTSQIRNITLAGHGQTGKTAFFEHLLYAGSSIPKPESTESGKTVSDNSPEEIERKISIYASLAHITWKNININVWDTPGSSDFAGEVIAAFRSTESALMLIDGRSGAQIETVKLWRDLDRRNKPRIIFINRCEEDRTDTAAVLKDIREKFKVEVCPVTIPIGKGASYKGVIDVLQGKAYLVPAAGQKESASEIPDAYKADYENARAVLAGAAAEGDDDLLVKFIDDGELTNEEIERGLKIAVQNNRVVPAFAGSTIQSSGFVPLMDFITEIAPDPEHALETAAGTDGKTAAVKISSDGTMSALVVKTASDQFSGRL